MSDSTTSAPDCNTLLWLAATLLLGLLAGCGPATVVVEGEFPAPTMTKLPLTLGVWYDQDFANHEFLGKVLLHQSQVSKNLIKGVGAHNSLGNSPTPLTCLIHLADEISKDARTHAHGQRRRGGEVLLLGFGEKVHAAVVPR